MTLERILESYQAFHQDPRNKAMHFFGVPLVTFSLLLIMSYVRGTALGYTVTLAGGFTGAVLVAYMWLHWRMAIAIAIPTLGLLWLAEIVSHRSDGMDIFWITFAGGWTFQLVGHFFEGKRPALLSNFLQIFAAPLFLGYEIRQALCSCSRQ